VVAGIVGFEEMIPESQYNGDAHLASAGAMVGFTVMMVLV
jgi:zinc transporter ZupT